MWGICIDSKACNGKLFQKIIEYQVNSDNHSAIILQPKDSENDVIIPISQIKSIENPPNFIYGENVAPVNHPNTVGKIETIIWHFKNQDFNFYISVDGKKMSKRYYTNDLIKC